MEQAYCTAVFWRGGEKIDLRKLFKNPISERWGKQICLN